MIVYRWASLNDRVDSLLKRKRVVEGERNALARFVQGVTSEEPEIQNWVHDLEDPYAAPPPRNKGEYDMFDDFVRKLELLIVGDLLSESAIADALWIAPVQLRVWLDRALSDGLLIEHEGQSVAEAFEPESENLQTMWIPQGKYLAVGTAVALGVLGDKKPNENFYVEAVSLRFQSVIDANPEEARFAMNASPELERIALDTEVKNLGFALADSDSFALLEKRIDWTLSGRVERVAAGSIWDVLQHFPVTEKMMWIPQGEELGEGTAFGLAIPSDVKPSQSTYRDSLAGHLQELIEIDPREAQYSMEMSLEHMPELFLIAQSQDREHWGRAIVDSDTFQPLESKIDWSRPGTFEVRQISLREVLEQL